MRRHFLFCETGAAAAEMALMLPLLIVLLFGVFEGGYFLWNEHMVVKGVRDGARYAGRLDFTNYTNCPTVAATAAANIQHVTRTGQLTGGSTRIPGWVDSDVTVSCSRNTGFVSGLYHDQTSGAPVVTVSSRVTYSSLFGRLTGLSGNLSLNASAQSPVMGI